MNLHELSSTMLPAIETELQRVIALLEGTRTQPFHAMLTYHMGWTGEGSGREAQGKRIRPLLALLTTAACDREWQPALPAAASIELIHNFSLVHDDIQDYSDLRRGRQTVWKKWDMPQAINVGDMLFILAQLSMVEIGKNYPAETALQAAAILHQACQGLSTGQYLDISYEKRTDLTVEDYWPMVAGKTAALLAACTQVGALLGGADPAAQEAWHNFGHYLGLAFQVQDDYLGIWGDSALTGKSTESDLVAGKKSLPVLYTLGKDGPFTQRWSAGPITAVEVAALAEQMTEVGARLYTQQMADQMTDLALQNLRLANPQGEASEALFELAQMLLIRQA
jgi:geranylgeranyl diphosphate synthase, type I